MFRTLFSFLGINCMDWSPAAIKCPSMFKNCKNSSAELHVYDFSGFCINSLGFPVKIQCDCLSVLSVLSSPPREVEIFASCPSSQAIKIDSIRTGADIWSWCPWSTSFSHGGKGSHAWWDHTVSCPVMWLRGCLALFCPSSTPASRSCTHSTASSGSYHALKYYMW